MCRICRKILGWDKKHNGGEQECPLISLMQCPVCGPATHFMEDCPILKVTAKPMSAQHTLFIAENNNDFRQYLYKNNVPPETTQTANETLVKLHAAKEGKKLAVVKPNEVKGKSKTK